MENRGELKKTLFIFDDICKKLNIKYYLIQGTCLGIYRDGDFINGDTDIDIFVDCDKETLRELFHKLDREPDINCGKTQTNIFDSAEGEELNRHVNRSNHWIDVYFKMLENRRRFFHNTHEIKFGGRTFNLPSAVEDYLALEFGKGWKTPSSQKSRGKGSPLPEASQQLDFNELMEADWIVTKNLKRV